MSQTFYGRLQFNPTTEKYDFDAPTHGTFQSWDSGVDVVFELENAGWNMVQTFTAPLMWLFVKEV